MAVETSKSELDHIVEAYLNGQYQILGTRGVPNPEDIPVGNRAAKLRATALFVDVRDPADIANPARREIAAKTFKGFFHGAVKVINQNDGSVRGYNANGVLALFVGSRRSSNAAKAAMQVEWFVLDVLRSKLKQFLADDGDGLSRLNLSIACGLDEGEIFAVRVGVRGTNDVAWVGRCTSTAARPAAALDPPQNIAVTRAVYKRLSKARKFSADGGHMWSDERFEELGGVSRAYRTTSFWCTIG